MHWHWGKNNNDGSEHSVGGVQYAMELHLVCYNKKFDNLRSAVKDLKEGSVAVLGIFYSIQRGDNIQWTELTAKLAEVKKPKGNAASTQTGSRSKDSSKNQPSGASPAVHRPKPVLKNTRVAGFNK